MDSQKSRFPNVFFLLGLCSSAALAIYFDRISGPPGGEQIWSFEERSQKSVAAPRDVTAEDIEHARTAWSYFESNYQQETGWVDSVSGFPAGTFWDQGSYLLGLVSAHGLGVISQAELDHRALAFLSSLENLTLFEGKLPNKVYNTQSLAMVDYDNQPQIHGIGWSALDVARMLSALRVLELHHPQHGKKIRGVLHKWKLTSMAENGRLIGASHEGGETSLLQEGRIGYEQYGARSAAMWGLDVLLAATAAPIMNWHDLDGIQVPKDKRVASIYNAPTVVASEPFFLQALEMGLTEEGALLSDRIYAAQKARFESTGHMTMVSESNIDQAPHFLYSGVFGNGKDWAVVTEQGESYEGLRTVSLKAAFAWHSIYDDSYSKQVLTALLPYASQNGWPSGLYESDGRLNEIYTANTNAIVLQSLYFKAFGPMMNLR